MTDQSKPSFLFVCTGNICRSPLADIIMRREAEERGLTLDIDSAGTGDWHIGDPPDPGSLRVAAKYGLDATTLRARTVKPDDFARFTHIIALDRSHLTALARMAPPDGTAELSLLLTHSPTATYVDVADPYGEPDSAFETAWSDIDAACRALADATLGPVTRQTPT